MRKDSAPLFFILLLLFGAFTKVGAAGSYWNRVEQGFPNQVQVYEYSYGLKTPELEINIQLPQLWGSFDSAWEEKFNQEQRERLVKFVEEMERITTEISEAGFEFPAPFQGLIDFEVKLNQGGLLSLVTTVYTYTGGAHGMVKRDYINLDLTTGKPITFEDLFTTKEEIKRVAQLINGQVSAAPDRFFIEQFTIDLFQPNQDFYLKKDQAVICFGLYELAPYAAGIQEFEVSAP